MSSLHITLLILVPPFLALLSIASFILYYYLTAKERHELVDRIMAKNYPEYLQKEYIELDKAEYKERQEEKERREEEMSKYVPLDEMEAVITDYNTVTVNHNPTNN